ncbi:MAG TPA: hypothetical protein VIX89_11785, partial [Bryobacteraceae bacterium]
MWGRLVTCRRLQIGLLNIPIKFSNRPINTAGCHPAPQNQTNCSEAALCYGADGGGTRRLVACSNA